MSKYICKMKVVDESLYPESLLKQYSSLNGAAKQATDLPYATIIFIDERFENMPVVRRIGDIIRIQKASFKIIDGIKQFIVDDRSHWCLFNTDYRNEDDRQMQTKTVDIDTVGGDEEKEEKKKLLKRSCMPYGYSGK